MPQKIITKNPQETGTEAFPYVPPLTMPANVSWEVLSGKASVTTDTRPSTDYGAGCQKSGDSQISAKSISVDASGRGSVKVAINY